MYSSHVRNSQVISQALTACSGLDGLLHVHAMLFCMAWRAAFFIDTEWYEQPMVQGDFLYATQFLIAISVNCDTSSGARTLCGVLPVKYVT